MTHSDRKAWDPTTIMWQVCPLGFAGVPVREPVDPAPRLSAVNQQLDYLVELGCTGLQRSAVTWRTSCGIG